MVYLENKIQLQNESLLKLKIFNFKIFTFKLSKHIFSSKLFYDWILKSIESPAVAQQIFDKATVNQPFSRMIIFFYDIYRIFYTILAWDFFGAYYWNEKPATYSFSIVCRFQ